MKKGRAEEFLELRNLPADGRLLDAVGNVAHRLADAALPGVANFVLCHVPEQGPDAAEIIRRCRKHGLFLRDAGAMGSRLGKHALRIAVKDAETNRRIIAILREAFVIDDKEAEYAAELTAK